MADVLASAMTWLAGQMDANATQTVQYLRGAVSVSVQATPGSSLLKASNAHDQKIERTDADFIITAASLAAAFLAKGVVYGKPERGDEIRIAFGSATNRYEVLPVGDDPPWRWADSYHNRYRLHGKYVGNV